MKRFNIPKGYFLALFCILFLAGCREEPYESLDAQLDAVLLDVSNGAGRSYFELPVDGDLASIPADPRNPITRDKVELGKLLFHETALGINPRLSNGRGTYSCASCHHAGAGFSSGNSQGIGEGGIGFGVFGEARKADPSYPLDSLDVQPVRSPSAINVAFQKVMLWNGQFGATDVNVGTEDAWAYGTPVAENHLGYEGVETQAIAGLKVHRMDVDQNLLTVAPGYEALFANAFPNVPAADRISREYAGLAIAAYERTLLSNQAPFQKWLRGDMHAMDDQEKNGAILFFGKANCGSCHTGPALNSMTFKAIGMGDLLGPGVVQMNPGHEVHLGRGGFTGKDEDLYCFKVPQLYNLREMGFYGHGATFTSLESVVRYKNAGVPQKFSVGREHLDDEFMPLNLSDQEIRDITAFLESGLYDDRLDRYQPSSVPSGQCFPNADPISRADLDCY